MTTITELKPESASTPVGEWSIDSIVSALRDLRHKSLAARNRLGKPAKLPSRAALTAIVEG